MNEDMPLICRQVWDRAVEATPGRDVMDDPALAAHVGSCMTCFRTLAELRDAPRLAAALRADAPAPAMSEQFWDNLAARTTDAAAAALRTNGRRRAALGRRVAGIGAVIVAAAAAWVLVARHPPVGSHVASPTATPQVASAAGGDEEEAADAVADVAELDGPALRQLLQRLRARGPANVSAIAAAGEGDGADAVFDEDGMTDALAELDGPALLRVERSLAGAAL
jgi:hypothetical protein